MKATANRVVVVRVHVCVWEGAGGGRLGLRLITVPVEKLLLVPAVTGGTEAGPGPGPRNRPQLRLIETRPIKGGSLCVNK